MVSNALTLLRFVSVVTALYVAAFPHRQVIRKAFSLLPSGSRK